MKIRLLNKSNRAELESAFLVQKAAYKIEADLLKASHFPPLLETLEEFQATSDEIYLAYIDQEIVGLIALEKKPDFILISKLVVNPTDFRKGVGGNLVKHALLSYPRMEFKQKPVLGSLN